MAESVQVGSVWRENDKRFERYVCIVALEARPGKHAIRGCTKDGTIPKAQHVATHVAASAFGKRFKLVEQDHG